MDPITHPALDPIIGSSQGTVPLAGIRVLADDWSGITNTRERKRRQNRLNQRIYRMRHGTQTSSVPQDILSIPAQRTQRGSQDLVIDYPDNRLKQLSQADGALLLTCPRQIERFHSFMRQALQDYSLNCPRPSQLQIIIRLNVLNAIARNALLIGLPIESLCRDEFVSPFQQAGPHPSGVLVPAPFCPDSLKPTHAQRTITHHPWIDLFPFPRFRDNVLFGLESGLFDDDELCADILGVESEEPDDRPVLLIWTDAWDPKGWEVSEAFLLSKWGWLVRSCPEMLEATNYWRTKRGQKMLSVDIVVN
ncbi:hypothetical protein F5Y09DRAFT_293714 [Xylaria sp. FL1042]|nr:hypothetical protein F5Y09DRAFT_293714 [Xylaria sp. FL1042]